MSVQKQRRGLFIAMEGMDGSGKSVGRTLMEKYLAEEGPKSVFLGKQPIPTHGPRCFLLQHCARDEFFKDLTDLLE